MEDVEWEVDVRHVRENVSGSGPPRVASLYCQHVGRVRPESFPDIGQFHTKNNAEVPYWYEKRSTIYGRRGPCRVEDISGFIGFIHTATATTDVKSGALALVVVGHVI